MLWFRVIPAEHDLTGEIEKHGANPKNTPRRARVEVDRRVPGLPPVFGPLRRNEFAASTSSGT
jgi:hypothetical protein